MRMFIRCAGMVSPAQPASIARVIDVMRNAPILMPRSGRLRRKDNGARRRYDFDLREKMHQNNDISDHNDEDGAEATPSLLEGKYRQQMRQIHPQKIELPISTLQAMIKDQITLNPEFQRRDRWGNKKRSRFVESVIMNVPVSPVFLGEDEYGSYVVLDGCQRLTAIHEFLKNAFPLEA
jgi:hypothetical protein